MTTDALLIQAFQAVQHELPELAEELFAQVLRREPDNPAVLLEIARCRLLQCRRGDAAEALRSAEKGAAADPGLPLEIGRVWRQAGDPARALHWYRAVSADSGCLGEAMLEICLLEDRRDTAPAGLCGPEWLSAPAPLRAMAGGMTALRSGDHERAAACLHDAVTLAGPSPLGVEAGGQLARLQLRLGRPEEAFALLHRVKQWQAPSFPAENARRLAARRAFDLETLRYTDRAWFERLHAAAPPAAPAPMILGHPRSGTTLLARLLADRGWRWVDEAPAFSSMARRLARTWPDAGTARGMAARLSTLAVEARLAALRDYSARMEDWGAVTPGRGPLLDKNPGLSCSLPVLMALLPGWHAVYLLRDPRDIALSCYTQNFGPTLLGTACLTLAGAAAAVAHTLNFWLRLRGLLPRACFTELRYEDIASDPGLLANYPALQPGGAGGGNSSAGLGQEPQAGTGTQPRHEGRKAPEPEPVPGGEFLPPGDTPASGATPAGDTTAEPSARLIENPSYAGIREAPHRRAQGRWRLLPPDLAAPLRALDELAERSGYIR